MANFQNISSQMQQVSKGIQNNKATKHPMPILIHDNGAKKQPVPKGIENNSAQKQTMPKIDPVSKGIQKVVLSKS